MRREISLFLAAVQFLTRVPIARVPGWEPDFVARSSRYFSAVGALVGVVCAAVLMIAAEMWMGALPAVLAVAAGVLVTGAFHEDGLADAADGLGGGQTRTRRLEIMKDSRIGTYGALALMFVIAFKAAALTQVPPIAGALALIAVHGGARAAAVVAMRALPYAGDLEWAKVKPVADGVTSREMVISVFFGLIATVPAFALAPFRTLVALTSASAAAWLVASRANRLIGGWVGDTMGAIEQVFEAGFLIAFAAWS